MAVVEVELIPELFSRMSMHPAEAVLDRVGRAAIAGQGVCGFLGRHRCKRNDAAGWLINAHEVSPKRQIGRELYARATVGARRQDVSHLISLMIRKKLRTFDLANKYCAGCSKRPRFSPAQPRHAKTCRSAGKAAASEDR